MSSIATSPASSGPAGAHFEANVGAYYLLSMLLETEPRGMPGVAIEKVAFQRAGEGRALDDVIVHARDPIGNPAVLEIQVKRSMAFTASDTEFRSVVAQIVRTSNRDDFWSQRYEMAIAISRTSLKTDGAYQDVLSWARAIGDSATFTSQLARHGASNKGMRAFVETFKRNLRDAGAPDDDEYVWKLLRRLHILVFDYSATGSAYEQWDRERAARVLVPEHASSAGTLHTYLVNLATQIASNAGDRNRAALVDDLRLQSFPLATLHRHGPALARITELSRAALADINDRLGDVKLARSNRLADVRSALDERRYVEIRGDAGVGKSGLLKHLAQQLSGEGRVLVLSPQRTPPGGWLQMRHILEFGGSARDLMLEIASSGGGIVFIDNLDFFDEGTQLTIIDLMRAVAEVGGIKVLVSARRSYAVDEPSWIPSAVVASLDGGASIVINELSDDELAELRDAAPALAPLLAEGHPARPVTGNLFRLSRLAMRPALQQFRSEEEMADWWWTTADGATDNDDGQRERRRALKLVAEQAVRGDNPYIVQDAPAAAVNALVRSETFRDLGNDRITFSHDVLREWAMACWLRLHPQALTALPTDRPARPDLARAIELLARLELGKDPAGKAWQQLLDIFSGSGMHGSWRRAVLLAVIRSENAPALLQHASNSLLSHEGAILVELIRCMQAIEVLPGMEVYADALAQLDTPPTSFNVPRSMSWVHLIVWILALGEQLPKRTISDVVSMYSVWSLGMLGNDILTPRLMPSIYRWLTAIENGRYADRRDTPPSWPFDGSVDREDIEALEQRLRVIFVSFGVLAPNLAAAYLTQQLASKHNRIAEGLMKFSGTLAQAAPGEMAALTEHYLLPDESSIQRSRSNRNPFEYEDHTFMPASPTTGPFLDLLMHSPTIGLTLIRTIVDRAITFRTGGRSGSSGIEINFPSGTQVFPSQQSYYWAREWSSAPYAVASALMAIELWAHRRIKAGESVEAIYSEVIGTGNIPACYLLPMVDLFLSHWPASRDFAVPFLSNVELLSLDRERQVHDHMGIPQIGGIRSHSELTGLSQLQQLPSRRFTLDDVLGSYATVGEDTVRDALRSHLLTAKERLGVYAPEATLATPAFLVVHALNLINPDNWLEIVEQRDGHSIVIERKYREPPEEEAHLAALRAQGKARLTASNMQAAISNALEDATQSSSQFAQDAVLWAMTPMVASEDNDDNWIYDQATLGAAMIAMRDGSAAIRIEHHEWARQKFLQALEAGEDPVNRHRSGLRFNPKAVAFAGMLYSLQVRKEPVDLRAILMASSLGEPAMANGLGAAISAVIAVEPRLFSAITRCAFQASVEPIHSWDTSTEEKAASLSRHQTERQLAVNREMNWLAQEGQPEPQWPVFPARPVRPRRVLRIGKSAKSTTGGREQSVQPDVRVDQQSAAHWLTEALKAKNASDEWILALAQHYSPWTAQANGMDGETALDIENAPSEWNGAYFSAVVRALPLLNKDQTHTLAIAPVISLADDSFFIAAEALLRSLDWAYFVDKTIDANAAVQIRTAVANRLQNTRAWQRMSGDRSGSVETRSASAIASIFFSDHGYIQLAKPYIFPAAMERIDPFLPALCTLAESAPSLYIAHLFLGLIEVAPAPRHIDFVLRVANCWLEAFSTSTEFWVGNDIGSRVCEWLANVSDLDRDIFSSEAQLRPNIDQILAKFIALGIAEASALERKLLNT